MESCLGGNASQMVTHLSRQHHSFSKMPEEHNERLRGEFEKLSAAGLRLKPTKCEFFKSRIIYLGHIVSKDGIETEKKKVIAIQEWPIPKTVLKYIAFWDLQIIIISSYPNMHKWLNPLISWYLERMPIEKKLK